jgi:hypothetical protein
LAQIAAVFGATAWGRLKLEEIDVIVWSESVEGNVLMEKRRKGISDFAFTYWGFLGG